MSFQNTRPDTFPPVIKNLLFINGLFFLVTQFLFRNQLSFEGYESDGLKSILGLWPVTSDNFRPYQLFTHMFTHDNFGHIFFNMFNLWMFGRILENVWGPKKFLSFYFICGIAAAAAHLGEQYLTGGGHYAIGASGAVMGIMAGFAYLFPNTELMFIFFPVPIKAKWVVLLMVGYDLFGGLSQSDGIAHWAHLGGAAAGFGLVFYWNKTNKKTFY
jgi:membrane associated rhomboid family serine protease